MSVFIFVYGTLRRNGPSHFKMGQAEFVSEASVPGMLYKISWFPGIVLDDTADRVIGELYRVDEEHLPLLDQYEGPQYRRRWTEVTSTKTPEPVMAWVWEWMFATDENERVRSGNWDVTIPIPV